MRLKNPGSDPGFFATYAALVSPRCQRPSGSLSVKDKYAPLTRKTLSGIRSLEDYMPQAAEAGILDSTLVTSLPELVNLDLRAVPFGPLLGPTRPDERHLFGHGFLPLELRE